MNKTIIVSFGDSLTVGFQSPTMTNPFYQETPYADFLKERLHDNAHFIIKGISGEMTDEMIMRFDKDVISYNPDYVIILGGSNDIGWGVNPEEVIRNLDYMYEKAISSNIIPVAVTVPSIRGFDSLIAPRQHLNDLIIKKCTLRYIKYIDFFTTTSESDSLRLAEKFSNDGLHLSTEGYKKLADQLYDEVFSKSL